MPGLLLAQRNPDANTGQQRLARSASAPRSRRRAGSPDPWYADLYASPNRAHATDDVLQYSPWGGWTCADPAGRFVSASASFSGGAATFADLPTPHERAAWQWERAAVRTARTARTARPPLRGTPNPHVVARSQVLPARGLPWGGAGRAATWRGPSWDGGDVGDARAAAILRASEAWNGARFAGGWSEEVPTWERGWTEVPSSSGWDVTSPSHRVPSPSPAPPSNVAEGGFIGGAHKLRAAPEGDSPLNWACGEGAGTTGSLGGWVPTGGATPPRERGGRRRTLLSGELQV